MDARHCLAMTTALALAVGAFAGEARLFDRTNYPWLPNAFKGAEIGDYAATRVLDIRFAGKGSGAQISILRGDRQPDMRTWCAEDARLVVTFRPTGDPAPESLRVEILGLDPHVKPQTKKWARSADVQLAEAVAAKDGLRELAFRLEDIDGFTADFVPATLKFLSDSTGRLVVTAVTVRGKNVSPHRLGPPKNLGDTEHVWLRVKGRQIVTSPLSQGGERPFVAAGVGYGKDVILHGYDEEVASFCKAMGLNTIRLAFYNQYFNNRAAEPLAFEDVIAFTQPVVNAAKRHGLYVILDDHAYFKDEIVEENARGEQKGAPWTTARFEEWVRCWGRVAEHYKDEPYILGYELCNEPVCEPAMARKWYKRAIEEIRRHDTRHIVIVGTHHWSHSRAMAATWEGVADTLDAPYNNVVFSFHDYPLDDVPGKVARYLADFQDRYGVPVMCTEFGGGGTPERIHRETQAGMLALFAREGIGWMLWTLEDKHGAGQPFPTRAEKKDREWVLKDDPRPRYWIPYPEIWGPMANIVATQGPFR